ncbi:glycosyltransferase family 2 protein [Pedobacter duraquae]|uniref:Glycosyl transferase family 2 n=1 Tax=Pedobacter duraquae TaxID=425511 RepID=A0A4R6IPW9_9SPHI|nr:glycosyltransferase family 2 protein [Pedobacter duraquae]TDO24056.1 glycosyl transferase family 2 [Pedobacter duraquae]
MALFDIPKWVKLHQFPDKKFKDLSADEIADLKSRLSKFRSADPEISVMIPAWNEENNIFRTLSSLASSNTKYRVELVVINNNSTDNTQHVLDELGVLSLFQPNQGTAHARQMGLEAAKGKYHLCADSDTYYPPSWVDLMVKPLRTVKGCVGVYGRYSFMPKEPKERFMMTIYEKITGLLIRVRKYKREHINFLGFNMGFLTEAGRNNGGFEVTEVRKFDNAVGSDYFVDEAEDGRMALNLKKVGHLVLVTAPKARVFTSARRLTSEGGLMQSFLNRLKLHSNRMKEYLSGPSSENF